MGNAAAAIRSRLFKLQDLEYKEFVQKLIPTLDPCRVIGVRTPGLRRLAKELAGAPDAEEFLACLPHSYYEENNLHAFLLEGVRDYERAMADTETFLPYIDNWATCDLFSPKVFRKHPGPVYEKIKVWIRSDQPYTVRYGIGLLLGNYLGEHFDREMPALVAGIRSQAYYVNMMIAWYFSMALVKQYDIALPFLTEQALTPRTHNKAIQKAIESRQIGHARKEYLKGLRVKPDRQEIWL